jgi:hypothetical protein
MVAALAAVVAMGAMPGLAVAAPVAPLDQVLPAAHARASRLWPRVGDGFEGRRIATPRAKRAVRSIHLGHDAAVSRADTLVESQRDASFDPRQAVYSSFRIGRDTLRFTYGHMAEEFGGVPRLMLGAPGSPNRSYPLAPLAHWNVDAVWYAGGYLIFGCTFHPEGVMAYEQIALWHLASGRWYTSPGEDRLNHRGFKLREIFAEWRAARASTDGTSVVLEGSNSVLALDPKGGSWILADAAGQGVPTPEHRVARRLAPVTAAMRSRLRAPLLAAFREWNHGVDSVDILEAVRDPCLAHRGKAAILVRATAPPPTLNAADSRDIQATLNSELFGIFLADSTVSAIESRVDMFPTVRFDDYTVYFDLDAPDDGMTVYGQGETYGDDEAKRTYRCGN